MIGGILCQENYKLLEYYTDYIKTEDKKIEKTLNTFELQTHSE